VSTIQENESAVDAMRVLLKAVSVLVKAIGVGKLC
jgi:hypothetical protein